MARHSVVHLANLDLNLLVALRELIRERNVTRAAARIGVTQPAASAALARLRRHFDDELLVRGGSGYTLSPLAMQLAEQVETVYAEIERLFDTDNRFDPATSRREFTLLMADYTIAVLGRRLSAAVAAEAPGVDLHIRMVREAFTADAARTIRFIDGIVSPPAGRYELPGVRSEELFTDRWVCVVDAANPVAAQGELTLARLAAMHWVAPYQPDRGLSSSAPMGRQLALFGIEPEIRTRVESYLAVPYLVAGTDRVALLQERLARRFAPALGLAVLPCPGEPEPVSERLWWHGDHDADQGHRWLKDLLVSLGKQL
ncbi:LysR family transcriptional regulator [Phaeacidiphilus oryzae]|uniref:LysR family transcriptional regulator n=1 Tax=Phaeacidiphilus oryzae TaxID=348818 RepID=UPI00055F6B51|nr:LysR substrate-binding domain-containing protein [Phaeacidiphilus oryzae]